MGKEWETGERVREQDRSGAPKARLNRSAFLTADFADGADKNRKASSVSEQ